MFSQVRELLGLGNNGVNEGKRLEKLLKKTLTAYRRKSPSPEKRKTFASHPSRMASEVSLDQLTERSWSENTLVGSPRNGDKTPAFSFSSE